MATPAVQWGWAWAKQTYGVGFRDRIRRGQVQGVSEPIWIAKKKKHEPAHWVKFEDADAPDRMMDTEIVRYLAPDTESAHAATFTRPVSEKQADELGYWDDARAEEMATLWEKGCFRRVKADQVDRKDICEGRSTAFRGRNQRGRW